MARVATLQCTSVNCIAVAMPFANYLLQKKGCPFNAMEIKLGYFKLCLLLFYSKKSPAPISNTSKKGFLGDLHINS